MRTTLNLNEEVINQVIEITGIRNKSKAINNVLTEYVQDKQIKKLLKMKGNLHLDDNWKKLREMELDEI
ncbi:MAG: type II toxin-antitoxin system VapB family antitoxin [SAR324 cluster bacterium]|nr:type II toxin-antitoxin system VapB family antitoxin [SAR324 cluster bacterium]